MTKFSLIIPVYNDETNSEKVLDAYNTFASDCYPKTFADVQNIVSFVNKICDDRVFERYFD